MMIAARGNKCGLGAEPLHQFETEHPDIEAERALEIGDLQVDVANADTGVDWRIFYGHKRKVTRGKKMAIFSAAQLLGWQSVDILIAVARYP